MRGPPPKENLILRLVEKSSGCLRNEAGAGLPFTYCLGTGADLVEFLDLREIARPWALGHRFLPAFVTRSMLNSQKIIIEDFATGLEADYRRNFGVLRPEYGSFISWAARLALENIGNSDMLYHNVEHTMLVTAAGQQILTGMHLSEGGVSPEDWLNFMFALLFHDVGYVRGVCRADEHPLYASGANLGKVELAEGTTDAALTPYHVSRSQLFVRERFKGSDIPGLDIEMICECIEMTRFPPPKERAYEPTGTYAGLVRAADFVGQLGDPNYFKKVTALFYEFEQLGMNPALGYRHPGDMLKGYASFFWKVVRPYLTDGIRYLRVTHGGKQWVANLQSHVFEVEHEDGQAQWKEKD